MTQIRFKFLILVPGARNKMEKKKQNIVAVVEVNSFSKPIVVDIGKHFSYGFVSPTWLDTDSYTIISRKGNCILLKKILPI